MTSKYPCGLVSCLDLPATALGDSAGQGWGDLCPWISGEQRATVFLLSSQAARQESPGSDAGQGKQVLKFEMHVEFPSCVLKPLNTLCFGVLSVKCSHFYSGFRRSPN